MVLRVKNGPKMFNMVLNGLQWSQMVLNGLRKSTINSIGWPGSTRFNLVLVWSKIVQILTKSHPNGSGITRSPGLVY